MWAAAMGHKMKENMIVWACGLNGGAVILCRVLARKSEGNRQTALKYLNVYGRIL